MFLISYHFISNYRSLGENNYSEGFGSTFHPRRPTATELTQLCQKIVDSNRDIIRVTPISVSELAP